LFLHPIGEIHPDDLFSIDLHVKLWFFFSFSELGNYNL